LKTRNSSTRTIWARRWPRRGEPRRAVQWLQYSGCSASWQLPAARAPPCQRRS
jgi:hypothetical protein